MGNIRAEFQISYYDESVVRWVGVLVWPNGLWPNDKFITVGLTQPHLTYYRVI